MSAAVLIPALAVALALGGPVIPVVIGAVVVLGAVEIFRLLRSAGHGSFPMLGAALALTMVADAAFPGVLDGSGLLLAAVGIVLVAIAAFTRADPRDGISAWMGTIFGAFYVGLLAFVVRLGQTGPALPADAPLTELGSVRGWILALVLAVWAYDTGAYLVGRRFGRRRFLTHLSPSKTYAGLIGGVLATVLVTAALLWGLGVDPVHALVLGPLVGFAAQAGDLAESAIKRAAGVKDSGSLIPGHGGVLDRIDSFLFAAPVMTLYVVAILG